MQVSEFECSTIVLPEGGTHCFTTAVQALAWPISSVLSIAELVSMTDLDAELANFEAELASIAAETPQVG